MIPRLARLWERWRVPLIAGIAVAITSAFLSLFLPDGWRWIFLVHFGRRHDNGQLIFPGPVAIGLGFLARYLVRRVLRRLESTG